MKSYSLITYKGKEILYVDYRETKSEQEMIDILESTGQFLLDNNIPRRILSNISGTYVLSSFMKRAKELGKKTQHLTPKEAIVGIIGPKKTLLKIYNLFTGVELMPFDNEEDAKEYLVKD
ncbi:MAG: hypothetical protein JXB49_03840 [Bacteroidales bacterium]|nr:hypothetical protein [Bacteroidales bacterium]